MCKCKVMHTLRYCIYYDSAGNNVGLEEQRLVLTLLASTILYAVNNVQISYGKKEIQQIN